MPTAARTIRFRPTTWWGATLSLLTLALAACAPPAPPAERGPVDPALAPIIATPAQPSEEVRDEPGSLRLDGGPADAPADTPPVQLRTYVVEPGDSVRTIAREFGVTNETIIWVNDLTDYNLLYIGQELKILPFSGLIHEVRPGDTVASIANSYDAKIADVIGTNRLKDPYIVVVGQKVVVPGGYRPLPEKVVPGVRSSSEVVQPGPRSGGDQLAAAVVPVRSLPLRYNTPQEQFVSSIAEAAIDSQAKTGIPASVTIAQAILESYWGSSRLSREANNYFGIKAQTKTGPAGVVWFQVWEVIGGRNVMRNEPFRAYNTAEESFVDHGRFFQENGRYAAALAARGDAKQFAREINRAGYATDPAYSSKLIGLMDRYDLYRFDD